MPIELIPTIFIIRIFQVDDDYVINIFNVSFFPFWAQKSNIYFLAWLCHSTKRRLTWRHACGIIFPKEAMPVNAEKTGAFISELRRGCGLTQKELADRIGVTDKAVSKWERGRGFPDVAILEMLAKALYVSVTELMNGERSTPENQREQSDSAIIETLLYVKQMSRKTFGVLIIIVGVCMIISPLFMTNVGLPVMILGILTILGGVFLIVSKKSIRSIRLPKLVLEGISLGALLVALVLESLSNGVILWWAAPPDESLKSTTYSYFALTPYGYAHFSPLITAVMTIGLVIFTAVVMTVGRKSVRARNALFVCIVVTAVISACPVLYGLKYVTVIGVGITLMLGAAAVFRAAANVKG